MKKTEKRNQEKMGMMEQESLKELSESELDQVVGGIITDAGKEWLTSLIQTGQENGARMENVMMMAKISCGKGALAQTTPAEARKFIQDHWDTI